MDNKEDQEKVQSKSKERMEVVRTLTKQYLRLHNISLHHSGEVDFDVAYRDLESKMKKYDISYEELDQEILRISEEKDKQRIVMMEKYRGELNGAYQTVWVALSINSNAYTSQDLQWKQSGQKFIPDLKSTKWRSISNEHLVKIMDEMHCEQTINYTKSKAKSKDQVKEERQYKGLRF